MKIIIIGNGIAGNTAAATIRKVKPDAEITIVSSEKQAHYSACALPQYISGEVKKRQLLLKTRKDYSRDRIKAVLSQKFTAIDPEKKQVFLDGRTLDYDKLVLATGSRPVLPPIKGADLQGVFTLKSLADAGAIRATTPRTAVVVGSGPIGIETAIALHKRGAEVYLVELLGRIMPRLLDERPSSVLKEILEAHGVRVLTGETVTGINGNVKVTGLVTSQRQIECDMVILSAGMKPDTGLARETGLSTGKTGGISVNDRMETNVKDIYACGDCVAAADLLTGEPVLSLLWHNAKKQGEVVGYNCCGVERTYPGSVNITSLDVFGTHVVSLGYILEEASRFKNVDFIEHDSEGRHQRLIFSEERLIGVQAVGDSRGTGAMFYALMGKGKITPGSLLPDSLLKSLLLNHLPYRQMNPERFFSRCASSE